MGAIETWAFTAFQIVMPVVFGVLGWFLKRQIDQGDKKLENMCRRLERLEDKGQEAKEGSIIADGLIREKLAAKFVSKEDCGVCAAERRETTTLLFAKVERLQEGQGVLSGKIDAFLVMAGEKFTRG